MDFTSEEINEFKCDCIEMLDESEKIFLKGSDSFSQEQYNTIFRCFHSLKGGAGMFGFQKIQSHMHKLEADFLNYKDNKLISSEAVSSFLMESIKLEII